MIDISALKDLIKMNTIKIEFTFVHITQIFLNGQYVVSQIKIAFMFLEMICMLHLYQLKVI
jgi:hypothetical protein